MTRPPAATDPVDDVGARNGTWHLVTGEYPPFGSGVADYTRLVAETLATRGESVHVWTATAARASSAVSTERDQTPFPVRTTGGVHVHELPRAFDPLSLVRLGRALDGFPGPRRLVVQYVPHAFGWRSMNLPICFWLGTRRNDRVWVLFHEVAHPWDRSHPLRRRALGAAHRAMASVLLRAADRVFVSIPGWSKLLEPLLVPSINLGRRRAPPVFEWSPIPSTLPTRVDASERAAARASISSNAAAHSLALQSRPELPLGPGAPPPHDAAAKLVGHFGTYGALVAPLVHATLERVLRESPDATAVLLGRGAARFAERFAAQLPTLASRIVVPTCTSESALAAHIAACDVMLQPYPDGVSSRRTTAMAPLALGVPIVTNLGEWSEPCWAADGAVALAASGDSADVAATCVELLFDEERRLRLATAAREVYERRFSIERTLERLLAPPAPGGAGWAVDEMSSATAAPGTASE